MKQFLKKMAKASVVVTAIHILVAALIYLQGFQYALALLTDSLRDPYFDGRQFEPDQNCFGAEACTSDTVRVLTYNVFCRVCSQEGDDPWEERVLHLRRLVERYDPDLIGSQELGGWQDMREYLPDDDAYGIVTFEFGPWTYGDSALFYRKSRYELLDSGQFWLSPNPGVPFGFSWLKLSAPRYLSWACLRDRNSGFTFLFLNSHLDNNPLNKESSAPLIFNTFSPHAGRMPVIFTGDFNTNATTTRYSVLQKGHSDKIVFQNAADIVPRRELQVYPPGGDEPASTTDFERFEHTIDHIFLAGPVEKEVLRWIVDENFYGNPPREASDHPAIFAEIRMTWSRPESLPSPQASVE